jgi:hypothetical protein
MASGCGRSSTLFPYTVLCFSGPRRAPLLPRPSDKEKDSEKDVGKAQEIEEPEEHRPRSLECLHRSDPMATSIVCDSLCHPIDDKHRQRFRTAANPKNPELIVRQVNLLVSFENETDGGGKTRDPKATSSVRVLFPSCPPSPSATSTPAPRATSPGSAVHRENSYAPFGDCRYRFLNAPKLILIVPCAYPSLRHVGRVTTCAEIEGASVWRAEVNLIVAFLKQCEEARRRSDP